MKKYFLTDLDGTLLKSDASLSKYTIDCLSTLLHKDIVISYATARSYISSNKVVSEIPWKYPMVLYNGAIIFDPVKKEVIDGFWLEPDITNDIIDKGREFGLTPLLFSMDADNNERVLHEKLVRIGDKEFRASRAGDPRFKEVEHLKCPKDFKTLVITYIGLQEELQPLKDAIVKKYEDIHIHFTKDNYIKDHYFLELSHVKANKYDGLKLWSKLVNCEPEEVTVFGDNLNDLGMFKAAGTKVAVSNGHSELLNLADFIAEKNDEDGVAKYIEKCC